jgi:hypothetical protein
MGVMTRAEEYRAKAAECEERAEQSADPFIERLELMGGIYGTISA